MKRISQSPNNKADINSHWWIWIPPVLILILMALIHFTYNNIYIFFSINSLSALFGDKFWSLITFMSDGLFVLIVLIPFLRTKPRIVWTVILASLIFLIVGQSLKHIFDVARPPAILSPNEFHLIGPAWTKNSFPSGHATMIFILAGAFFLITRKTWVRLLILTSACFIALSRIVVGVHWPQDVLAGAGLGWLAFWAGYVLSGHSQWAYGITGQKIMGSILLFACVLLIFFDFSGHQNILIEQRIFTVFFLGIGLYEYLQLFGIDILKLLQTKNRPRN